MDGSISCTKAEAVCLNSLQAATTLPERDRLTLAKETLPRTLRQWLTENGLMAGVSTYSARLVGWIEAAWQMYQ